MLSTILYRNYLSYMDYRELFIKGKDLDGTYVELGFGAGNSAKAFVSLIKEGKLTERPIWIFDSFKGIPQPTEKDLEFEPSLKKGMFGKPIQPALDIRFDIPKIPYRVVKGYIEETLDQYDGSKISILNLDLSSYSSTKIALEKLHRFLPRFGILIVPSYNTVESVKVAVDEFLSKNNLTHQLTDGVTFINTPPKLRLTGKTSRDTILEEKRVPVKKEVVLEPFKDRYKKKAQKVITYVKQIRDDVKVLGKKVTR